MKLFSFWRSTLSLSLLTSSLAFAAAYDDVNNDLSNNQNAPTVFAIDSGANTITGRFSATNDYDYVTITVPSGSVLASVFLTAYNNPGNSTSFMAIAPGSIVPLAPPNPGTAAGLLGYVQPGAGMVGTDILDDMGSVGNGSFGFSGPLPAGTYTFWLQDFNNANTTYTLTLNVTATPAAPVVKVSGKSKITTTKTKVKLKGSVVGSATMVDYRIGTKGAFKPVTGTPAAWTINASKLKPGKNVITIQAMGVGGTTSTKVTVTVKKK